MHPGATSNVLNSPSNSANNRFVANFFPKTTTSFMESVSQSKIKEKVDESVIVMDFFNPERNLIRQSQLSSTRKLDS